MEHGGSADRGAYREGQRGGAVSRTGVAGCRVQALAQEQSGWAAVLVVLGVASLLSAAGFAVLVLVGETGQQLRAKAAAKQQAMLKKE